MDTAFKDVDPIFSESYFKIGFSMHSNISK